MQGGGTQDEITEFMALVSEVQSGPIRRPHVLIVHHENRAGQVSGAWEHAIDTLIHVQGEGNGRTRVFWQKVRWSSALHATTTHLLWAPGETFTVEEREEITAETMADALLAAVRAIPGGSWRKIREHEDVKGNVSELADIRDRLLADGLLVNRATHKGRFSLWAADDPATPTLTGSELRTALEPLGSPSPDGAVGVERFPVPDVSQEPRTEPPHRTGLIEAETCTSCGDRFKRGTGNRGTRCARCVRDEFSQAAEHAR